MQSTKYGEKNKGMGATIEVRIYKERNKETKEEIIKFKPRNMHNIDILLRHQFV